MCVHVWYILVRSEAGPRKLYKSMEGGNLERKEQLYYLDDIIDFWSRSGMKTEQHGCSGKTNFLVNCCILSKWKAWVYKSCIRAVMSMCMGPKHGTKSKDCGFWEQVTIKCCIINGRCQMARHGDLCWGSWEKRETLMVWIWEGGQVRTTWWTWWRIWR